MVIFWVYVENVSGTNNRNTRRKAASSAEKRMKGREKERGRAVQKICHMEERMDGDKKRLRVQMYANSRTR